MPGVAGFLAGNASLAGPSFGPDNDALHASKPGATAACADHDSRKTAFVVDHVASAISPGRRPLTAATASPTNVTYAGSLGWPRWGTGARKGASVSTRSRSSGHSAAASRTSPAFLN